MLKAFCCAEAETLPQLTVAVSSFMHHNPSVPVIVYCQPGTAIDPLLELGVTVERLALSSVMMGALDHLTHQPEVTRAVHIGANTLTQDCLPDLELVNMEGVSIAASSLWAFAPAVEYHGWYMVEDVEGEKHRSAINPRYFNIDFIMFNFEHLRLQPRYGYLLDFIKSRFSNECDFLNMRLRDDHYLNMPGTLNVATEDVIYPYLPSRELVEHRKRMRLARVARFPGDIVPWKPYRRFNRVSMQLPMVEYAQAASRVQHLLPPEVFAVIEANREYSDDYLGLLPTVLSELQALTEE